MFLLAQLPSLHSGAHSFLPDQNLTSESDQSSVDCCKMPSLQLLNCWTCLIIKRWKYNPHERCCSSGWSVCAGVCVCVCVWKHCGIFFFLHLHICFMVWQMVYLSVYLTLFLCSCSYSILSYVYKTLKMPAHWCIYKLMFYIYLMKYLFNISEYKAMLIKLLIYHRNIYFIHICVCIYVCIYINNKKYR